MRIYLFDRDNGVFQGEDFCEDQEFEERDGMTTVAPPRKAGHVAFFDQNLRSWRLVKVEEGKDNHHV